MPGQPTYADAQGETAQRHDPYAADRPVRHPCPFCRGVMVLRKPGAKHRTHGALECTNCPTVIFLPLDLVAPASRPAGACH